MLGGVPSIHLLGFEHHSGGEQHSDSSKYGKREQGDHQDRHGLHLYKYSRTLIPATR